MKSVRAHRSALVQESIADKFLEMAAERVKRTKTGHPLDTETMIGAQASTGNNKRKSWVVSQQVAVKVHQVLTGGSERNEVVLVSILNQPFSKAPMT